MEPAPRSALMDAIVSAMQGMMRSRATAGPEPWLDLDLTLPQLKALLLLGAMGSARPSVIAQSIGVTANGVTGLLDRLEERAFVRRQPDRADRRAVVVQLEASGQALVNDIYFAGREQLIAILERMADDDLRALRQGISALMAQQTSLRGGTAAIGTGASS